MKLSSLIAYPEWSRIHASRSFANHEHVEHHADQNDPHIEQSLHFNQQLSASKYWSLELKDTGAL